VSAEPAIGVTIQCAEPKGATAPQLPIFTRRRAPDRAICASAWERDLVISGFPEVRYADADGVSIAFSVRGGGPIDIVREPGAWTTIVGNALDPVVDAHYEELSRFARLIVIDRRGRRCTRARRLVP
jgi:hypothetical protein